MKATSKTYPHTHAENSQNNTPIPPEKTAKIGNWIPPWQKFEVLWKFVVVAHGRSKNREGAKWFSPFPLFFCGLWYVLKRCPKKVWTFFIPF
jgi:hypothetical protein